MIQIITIKIKKNEIINKNCNSFLHWIGIHQTSLIGHLIGGHVFYIHTSQMNLGLLQNIISPHFTATSHSLKSQFFFTYKNPTFTGHFFLDRNISIFQDLLS